MSRLLCEPHRPRWQEPGWPRVLCEAGVTSPVERQAAKWAASSLPGEPGSWRGVSGEALTKESERELVWLNVNVRHVFVIDTSS